MQQPQRNGFEQYIESVISQITAIIDKHGSPINITIAVSAIILMAVI